MGHAGAFALPGEPSAQDKIKALQAADCTIVNHPSRFGPVLKSILEGSTPSAYGVASPSSLGGAGFQQSRGIHTAVKRPRLGNTTSDSTQQTRSIYLTQATTLEMLRQREIPVVDSNSTPASRENRLLAVTLNRSTRSPCIIISPSTDGSDTIRKVKRFDYAYATGAKAVDISAIAQHLNLDAGNEAIISSLRAIVTTLVSLFAEKEAFLLETHLQLTPQSTSPSSPPNLAVAAARFGFDDAAHRSGNRQADIQALRDTSVEDPMEVEAEKDGIVYIKLPNGRRGNGEGEEEEEEEIANIGTLVNGAGLAMNTIDALAHAGGRAANFLDTGGKATSETVKKSFEVILTDPRVKVGAYVSEGWIFFSLFLSLSTYIPIHLLCLSATCPPSIVLRVLII